MVSGKAFEQLCFGWVQCLPPESSAPAAQLAEITVALLSWVLTLDHPAFISCYPDNGADPTPGNGCDSLVHGAVYWVSVSSRRCCCAARREPTIVLPSMFPCSVSTKTQSKPQRAMVLDRLLPGSICQLETNQPTASPLKLKLTLRTSGRSLWKAPFVICLQPAWPKVS